MPKFDDELDVIPTKSAATPTPEVSTPTAAAATAPAKAKVQESLEDEAPVATKTSTKTKSSDDDDLDVDFGDQKLMSMGDGLNRIRADKNKVVRFALLDFIKPKSAKSHFVDTKDKKGTFRCAEPATEGAIPFCCAKLEEEGMVHVVALAVLYTNADPKDGSYVKGTPIEWEIGYVDFSRSNFRSVSNLNPEDSSVYDIDIVMSKKTNGIGYEFVLRAPKAKWKQNAELAAEIEAEAQKYVNDGGKKLIGKLGRKLSLMEWKALLSGQAASGASASLEDIEDM